VTPLVPKASDDDVPRIVLDTNAVLDWLYFRDRRCAALAEAVTTGRVRWIASRAMRDEIEHVLDRGSLGDKWPDGAASVRDGWQRWATMVEADAPAAPHALRCTDVDDQKFIDLALDVRAAALLSADRAVLRLARRAIAWRLAITTVEQWRIEPASVAGRA
jgi:predicted nucleic acid-binding protein